MPTFLKTKFPCAGCGAPTQVRKTRDAAHARCPPCAELQRRMRGIDHRDHESDEAVKKSRHAKTGAALMQQTLLAVAKRLEAAAACLDVSALAATVQEQRHLLRCADSRIAWATGTLKRNMHHLQAAQDEVLSLRGIQVVEGGRTGVEVEPEPLAETGETMLKIVLAGESS